MYNKKINNSAVRFRSPSFGLSCQNQLDRLLLPNELMFGLWCLNQAYHRMLSPKEHTAWSTKSDTCTAANQVVPTLCGRRSLAPYAPGGFKSLSQNAVGAIEVLLLNGPELSAGKALANPCNLK